MMAKEFKKSENEFRKIVFKPKRKLGQNFLFDKNYLRKILTCIKSDKNLVLVEIGSGYGTLTKLLMKKEFKRFFSIEKDNDLFQKNVSEKEERGYPVDYILGDALKIDWSRLCYPAKEKYMIVGNLPYYISNSLIVDLLLNWNFFYSFHFLIQKEVGLKWISTNRANSSEYSALSVFINYVCAIKSHFEVPKSVFVPSPKVDGIFLNMKVREQIPLNNEELKRFLLMLKKCFKFRRKTLIKNILDFLGKEYFLSIEQWFKKNNLRLSTRPQELDYSTYYNLFDFLLKRNLLQKI